MSYHSSSDDTLAGCGVALLLIALITCLMLGVLWFVVSNMGPPAPAHLEVVEPEVIFIPQVVGDTDGMEAVYMLE